jgi:hypothetical protein
MDFMVDTGAPPAWQTAISSMLDMNDESGGPTSKAQRKLRAAMELGLIVDGDGLRSDGTRGAPQASIPEHEPFWHSLIVMLEEATQMHESFGFEIEACGVAASHPKPCDCSKASA